MSPKFLGRVPVSNGITMCLQLCCHCAMLAQRSHVQVVDCDGNAINFSDQEMTMLDPSASRAEHVQKGDTLAVDR